MTHAIPVVDLEDVAERMPGLYARAHSVPGDAFAMGPLPQVRPTVNDYPTWTYPETYPDAAADEDRLGADSGLAGRPAVRGRTGRELSGAVVSGAPEVRLRGQTH